MRRRPRRYCTSVGPKMLHIQSPQAMWARASSIMMSDLLLHCRVHGVRGDSIRSVNLCEVWTYVHMIHTSCCMV